MGLTYLFSTVTVIRYYIIKYNNKSKKEEVAFESADYEAFTSKLKEMKKKDCRGLKVRLVDGNEPEKSVDMNPGEFSQAMDKPEFKSLVEIKKRPELRYNITSTTKTVPQEVPETTEHVV